jgi:hypothetical protein
MTSRPLTIIILVIPLCVSLCTLLACRQTAIGQQQEKIPAEQQKLLDDIRAALAQRDLAEAKTKLQQAAAIKQPAAFVTQVERLSLLQQYIADFLKSVDEGGRTLQGTEELLIGETRVAVVEYAAGRLVLRVAGENKRYTLQDMPPKVALTLASRVLKADAPQNKVFTGAFLAMDAKGDRTMAREAWDDARRGGIDVSALLGELDIMPPTVSSVEAPLLNRLQRALLDPDKWYLVRRADNRWQRGTLDKIGVANAEGRLQIQVPQSETEPVRIAYRTRVAGNFLCRIILQDVAASQTFGLLDADGGEMSYYVTLPPGSMFVEFGRQADAIKCFLNGKEIEVQQAASASPRVPGLIGLTVPPGGNCTVAIFEMRGP